MWNHQHEKSILCKLHTIQVCSASSLAPIQYLSKKMLLQFSGQQIFALRVNIDHNLTNNLPRAFDDYCWLCSSRNVSRYCIKAKTICIRLLDLDCNKPFVFEKYTVLLIVKCTSMWGRKKSPTSGPSSRIRNVKRKKEESRSHSIHEEYSPWGGRVLGKLQQWKESRTIEMASQLERATGEDPSTGCSNSGSTGGRRESERKRRGQQGWAKRTAKGRLNVPIGINRREISRWTAAVVIPTAAWSST